MDTIQRGQSALVDIVERSRRAKELKGYAGIGNGAGGYTTYVSYQPGKVYARIVDGVESSITVAIPQGVNLDPSVMCDIDSVDGQLVLRRPDANDAARLYGDSAPITTVPPQPQTGYPAPTDPGELTLYGVNNALLGGLDVRITAYTHRGGRWDGSTTLTLTPTATTGMRAWLLVGINTLTNTITQALAQDRSLGFTPMQLSDCDAIIAANPDVDWRAAVDLTYSATGIDPAKIASLTGRSEIRPKSNHSASAAPTVTDDIDAGYSVGSLWINTSADDVYQCTDSTAGAANWELLNGSTFTGDAFDVPYTPTTSADWSSVPADAGDALDTLATDVAALGATGVYTPPPTTGWSWLNQGGASIDSSSVRQYLEAPSNATFQIRGRYRDQPSTPFTITAAFKSVSLDGNCHFGFLWYDGSTEAMTFGAGQGTIDGQIYRVWYKWDDIDTLNASYFNTATPFMHVNPLWLRISDDGTDIKAYYSADGENFIELASQARADWLTPSKVGFFIAPGATNIASVTLLSWEEA